MDFNVYLMIPRMDISVKTYTHVCSTQPTVSSSCNLHNSSFNFPKDTKRKCILRINKLRDEHSLKQWNQSLKKTCKNFVPWLEVCSIRLLETSRPSLSPAHQLSPLCHGLLRHIQRWKVDFIPKGHWSNLLNRPSGVGPSAQHHRLWPLHSPSWPTHDNVRVQVSEMTGFKGESGLAWPKSSCLSAPFNLRIYVTLLHWLKSTDADMLFFLTTLILNLVFLSSKKLQC